jgi:beta-phosphoglucomutase family hydrolase
MIKAIIFDMDGVLIDSEPIHLKATNRILKKFGVELKGEENLAYQGMNELDYWKELVKKFSLPSEPEKLAAEKNFEMWKILKSSKLKLFPHVKRFLKRMKNLGLKLAVASSSPRNQINFMLEKTGILDFFDVIISGDSLKRGKPHPDIFLITAEKLGLEPEECVVIEDSRNGIMAGKSAGMIVIAMGALEGSEMADLRVEGFRELLSLDFREI